MFTDAYAFSGYSVDDLAAALVFYRDTLGLPVAETPQGLQMELKGTTVFLYPKADHTPATFTVLNFTVKNIDDTVAEMIAKGIALENYDSGPMKADERGIYRGLAAGHGPDIAWFKDPAGNILSVLQHR